MKEKKTLSGNPILISLFCMGMVIIFAITFGIARIDEWIPYWIYYKPFYTLFKNSIYLPFYLRCAGIFLVIGIPNFNIKICNQKSML